MAIQSNGQSKLDTGIDLEMGDGSWEKGDESWNSKEITIKLPSNNI
jgi:hypothetical protein